MNEHQCYYKSVKTGAIFHGLKSTHTWPPSSPECLLSGFNPQPLFCLSAIPTVGCWGFLEMISLLGANPLSDTSAQALFSERMSSWRLSASRPIPPIYFLPGAHIHSPNKTTYATYFKRGMWAVPCISLTHIRRARQTKVWEAAGHVSGQWLSRKWEVLLGKQHIACMFPRHSFGKIRYQANENVISFWSFIFPRMKVHLYFLFRSNFSEYSYSWLNRPRNPDIMNLLSFFVYWLLCK